MPEATGPNAKRIKIALLAPNGAGKDAHVIATAALWWAHAFPRGKVVIISKDSKQINEQTVPAIQKHIHKFEGWKEVQSPYYKVTTLTGGTIHCFVTDEASRLEGWHKENDTTGPLLMIVNEAKSVAETHFQAIDRCTWNALMLISSGGPMQGRFYDAFHKLTNTFVNVQAGLKDCPHIPREKIADIIATYGEDHPFTQSAIYGRFMAQPDGDDYVVDSIALNNLLTSPPKHKPGMKVAFCDFAAGRAEHALGYRDGNKITVAAAWIDANKQSAVMRFIREFMKLGLKQHQVFCDAADLEMWKLLRDAGWTINRKNFGGPANNDQVYVSWGAEAWHELGFAVTKGEVILDDDDKLKAQLTTRKRVIKANGKSGIEDKHDMAKPPRNLPSPDRADVVVGAYCVYDHSQIQTPAKFITGSELAGWRDHVEDRENHELMASIGASAGF